MLITINGVRGLTSNRDYRHQPQFEPTDWLTKTRPHNEPTRRWKKGQDVTLLSHTKHPGALLTRHSKLNHFGWGIIILERVE